MDIGLVYHPETMAPAIAVGDGLFRSIEDLVAAHPGLAAEGEGNAAGLAIAYNHLARGDAYEVIEDPAAFEAAYRAAYAAEDPGAAWSQDRARLSDFGIPDFERIHAPVLAGEVLTFFARDALTGLAYRVGGLWKSPAVASYEPMRVAARGG